MTTIKIDNTYFNQVQRDLDLEDLADLEIDLHFLRQKALRAKGPRAQKFWGNAVKEKEAEIASLKAQM